MDRSQEKQFLSEHAVSWRLVASSWLVLAIVIAAVLLTAWSPLKVNDVKASAPPQLDWHAYSIAPKLQHRTDDPDDYFDPSDP